MFYPADAVEALIQRMGLRDSASEETPPGPRQVSCDPLWKRISASLRRDPNGVPSLYLKLPATTLWQIILGINHVLAGAGIGDGARDVVLEELYSFLYQEHARSAAPLIFLRIPVVDVEKDIESLKTVQEWDKSGYIRAYLEALQAGLRNDPEVDWISRCGGPACDVSLDPTPHDGDEEILGLPE